MAGEEFPSPAGSSKALGSGPYGEVIDACRRAGSEPQVGQVATQITSTTNLVAVELGASIMPAAMANAGFAGVRYLPIKGIAPIARIALVAQARKHSLGKAAVRPERRL
jgi:DNA-binding transcriptional LysR family regulator